MVTARSLAQAYTTDVCGGVCENVYKNVQKSAQFIDYYKFIERMLWMDLFEVLQEVGNLGL